MATVPRLHERLFPHQADLVRWALRRGRAAVFADTGLGKTDIQIEWARCICAETGGSVMILAPLAVAEQTSREARLLDVTARVVLDQSGVEPGISITNYERLHRFDPTKFVGMVADESSIMKHHDAKTLARLIEAFEETAWKLCCTATPAPNDFTELGTHAEFLGICSRAEMLSEFFCHDGGETQKWRLKGHAKSAFWSWVASWGALVRKPSDLGHDDSGYALPPLTVHQHTIPADAASTQARGLLFALPAETLMDQRAARRATVSARVQKCVELVNGSADPWVVWCELNDESVALAAAIDGSVEITGAQEPDDKRDRMLDFIDGKYRVLVSKSSICGFGVNLQRVARVAFVGIGHSWEAYYQAVRRCWRFGQTRPVEVHIFSSELEGSIVENLQRKELDALTMSEELSRETRDAMRAEVLGAKRVTNTYDPKLPIAVPSWLVTEPRS